MMLGAMILFVPLAISNRRVAYLLWGWTAVLSPVYYLYGFMQSFRFNMMFAVIALTLAVIKPRSQNLPFTVSPAVVLMLLLLLHGMLSIAFGYPDNPFNESLGIQFFKSMVFCLVMFMFIENREHMHALLVMLALGLGFHGVLEGLKVIVTAGGYKIPGIDSSMMSDNNHFGVAMVMLLPILYYLTKNSVQKMARIGFSLALFITGITVLGTNSRGAVIALGLLGLLFFLSSQKKLKVLLILAIPTVVFLFIASDAWFARMDTISQVGEDTSFMGRVVAWKISSEIALENPIFGGGFHAVQVQYIWDKFKYEQGLLGFISTPEPRALALAAHSIYFEIFGDMGFVGLILFVTIFFNAIRTGFQIRKLVSLSPDRMKWAVDMANALMLAILSYLVGGAAVSLAYFELPFMLVMLMEILRQYVLKEVRIIEASRLVLPEPCR